MTHSPDKCSLCPPPPMVTDHFTKVELDKGITIYVCDECLEFLNGYTFSVVTVHDVGAPT